MFSPLTVLCVSLAPSTDAAEDQIYQSCIALAQCQSHLMGAVTAHFCRFVTTELLETLRNT